MNFNISNKIVLHFSICKSIMTGWTLEAGVSVLMWHYVLGLPMKGWFRAVDFWFRQYPSKIHGRFSI